MLAPISVIAALILVPFFPPPVPAIDLDGDGLGDQLIADPLNDTVQIIGGGGAILRTFVPPDDQSGEGFGSVVRLIPDVTGDGVPELVVLAPAARSQGAVDLFNPVTGARLWRSLGPVAAASSDGWWFQNDVLPVADQNDDGSPDLIVDASPDGDAAKYAALLDGVSGRLLTVRAGHASDMVALVGTGTRLYRATDVDDDGFVNSSDFAAFLDSYMRDAIEADLNNDGVVNGLDMELMIRDALSGATTIVAGGSSGGGSGGGGNGGGGSSGGGLEITPAVAITPGSCTTIWTSSSTGYNPCSSTCTPMVITPACNDAVTPTDQFQYRSEFCGQNTYPLVTHRTGELTVQGVLATLLQMYNTHSGAIPGGSALLAQLPCIPNDGIDWTDVLAFGWSTDQPLMISTEVASDGSAVRLALAGSAGAFTQINVYFHIWVRDASGVAHLCCFRIPLIALPDCSSVTMQKFDQTSTASPLLCEDIIVAGEPVMVGALLSPAGGVARWRVIYTIPGAPTVITSNIGPTAFIDPPAGATAADVEVDYQVGSQFQCGPSFDTRHFTVDVDTDADGLPDSCELALHDQGYPCLNVFNADSDGDGFADGAELALGSDPCDPLVKPNVTVDSDGDGLTDYEEVAIHHSDPRRVDTDNDGADDFGEVELKRLGHPVDPRDPFSFTRALGQPLVRDGYTALWTEFDLDGDHLFDSLEEILGLRTDRADTDGDGLPDGVELRHDMNALQADAGVGSGFGVDDSDGDGLSDSLELRLGLDSGNADSDGDGLLDGFEIAAGLDPLSGDSLGPTGTAADLAADLDGDGLTNLQEQTYGLNPQSADSDEDGVPDALETEPEGESTTIRVALTPSIPPCGIPLPSQVRVGSRVIQWDGEQPRVEEWKVRAGSAAQVRLLSRGFRLNHEVTACATLPPDWEQWLRYDRRTSIEVTLDGDENIGVLRRSSETADLQLFAFEGWARNGGTPPADLPPQTPQIDVQREQTRRFDQERWLLMMPTIAAYDLQEWQPFARPGNSLGFLYDQYADLLNLRSNHGPVTGALTDGASVCVVRAELAASEGVPPDWRRVFDQREVQISKRKYVSTVNGRIVWDDTLPSYPEAFGSITPVTPGAPWSMPDLDQPEHLRTTHASFKNGVALFVPPESYLDRASNPGRVAQHGADSCLDDAEATRMVFGVNEVLKAKFQLRRPPIVLVHGIRSGPETWVASGWNAPSLATPTVHTRADWGSKGTEGFAESVGTVAAKINSTLIDYRDGNVPWPNLIPPESPPSSVATYAARRADVVAHSQGGQITRLYTLPIEYRQPNGVLNRAGGFNPGNLERGNNAGDIPWYERPQNYYRGDIRRFITIGSPFRGSPFANAACNAIAPANVPATQAAIEDSVTVRPSAPVLVWAATVAAKAKAKKAVEGHKDFTCLADLAIGSTAYASMDVPVFIRGLAWMPIVCYAMDPAVVTPSSYAETFATRLSTLQANPTMRAFLPPELLAPPYSWLTSSDSIVPTYSQANLGAASITTPLGTVDDFERASKARQLFGLFHSSVMTGNGFIDPLLPNIPPEATETGAEEIPPLVRERLSGPSVFFIRGSY